MNGSRNPASDFDESFLGNARYLFRSRINLPMFFRHEKARLCSRISQQTSFWHKLPPFRSRTGSFHGVGNNSPFICSRDGKLLAVGNARALICARDSLVARSYRRGGDWQSSGRRLSAFEKQISAFKESITILHSLTPGESMRQE